jgi:hypothetical protein
MLHEKANVACIARTMGADVRMIEHNYIRIEHSIFQRLQHIPVRAVYSLFKPNEQKFNSENDESI